MVLALVVLSLGLFGLQASSLRLSERGEPRDWQRQIAALSIDDRGEMGSFQHVEEILEKTQPWRSELRAKVKEVMLRPVANFSQASLRQLVIQELYLRYPSRPAEDRWQELFMQATRTPEDPCDADLLSTYGWNAGFGSAVNILANEVALAAYFGRTVARCTPATQDHRSFGDLWGSPVRFCNRSELCPDTRQWEYDDERRTPWGYAAMFWAGCLNTLECEMNPTLKMPWLTPTQRHPGIFPEFRGWSKRFRHMAYDMVFRLTPLQQQSAESWARQHGPPPGVPYVAVHLRGTDKFQEAPNTSVSEYVYRVRGAVNATKAYMVYVASDDLELAAQFAEQFRAAEPEAKMLLKPEVEYPGRRGGHNLGRVERTVFMAELQIMRNATAFVGTSSSNIGRLIYFLRTTEVGEDNLTVSVDDNGDFFTRFC